MYQSRDACLSNAPAVSMERKRNLSNNAETKGGPSTQNNGRKKSVTARAVGKTICRTKAGKIALTSRWRSSLYTRITAQRGTNNQSVYMPQRISPGRLQVIHRR